jgi:Tol biopolymer transport system component
MGLSFTWEQNATAALTRDPHVYQLTDYWRDRSPVWSPDGTRLAFQTYSHDHYEIVVINADGTGRTQLTKNSPLNDRAINCVSPAWSPDGQYIIYLTDEKGLQEWEF